MLPKSDTVETTVFGEGWYTLHPRGLQFERTPTWEEWVKAGEDLIAVAQSIHFWIGDWLNFGEGVFGEMASQVMDTYGYDYQTCANDKWVCSRVAFPDRREKLYFGHHEAVASLEPKIQGYVLDEAERQDLTVVETRHRKNEVKAGRKLPEPLPYPHLVNRSQIYDRAKLIVWDYLNVERWLNQGHQGPQVTRRIRQRDKFQAWLIRWCALSETT